MFARSDFIREDLGTIRASIGGGSIQGQGMVPLVWAELQQVQGPEVEPNCLIPVAARLHMCIGRGRLQSCRRLQSQRINMYYTYAVILQFFIIINHKVTL